MHSAVEKAAKRTNLSFADSLSVISSAAAIDRLALQKRLLQRAVSSGEPLNDVLVELGLTFDDLVYVRDSVRPDRAPRRYVKLDDVRCASRGIPLVSFFTGAGGIDLGFEAAGFDSVCAVEHNPLFAETLRINHPDVSVLGPPDHSGDVSQFDDTTHGVRQILGRGKMFDGVFVGGPPCQPFSVAASQRFSKSGGDYKRTGFAHEKNGNLFFDFLNIVGHFRPRAVLIENVPGLGTIDGGEQLARAVALLTSWGYSVIEPLVLNAADFEVPQYRRRLFVIAFREPKVAKRFLLPRPLSALLTVDAAIFSVSSKHTHHETRQHSAGSISRYMELGFGERDALGRVDRLKPDAPSKTVIAGGVSGGGRSHLHPFIPRTLSVRECARLQTFPDSFTFAGPIARQFTQVGNAVPPLLAYHLGAAIARALTG